MLAAAGAVAVAGAVASVVVATSTGGGGNRELEKTTKEFLAATAAGASAERYYGVCDGTPTPGCPRRLVEAEGPGFTFDVTSSTATGAPRTSTSPWSAGTGLRRPTPWTCGGRAAYGGSAAWRPGTSRSTS
ncbi:hypothetical protein ACU686_10895 [Yinghuangia aomiensis]